MDATGSLQLVFDADPWGSTISFAPGIPVTLSGTLELTFATDVNLASQVGLTFDLFDWAGVSPTGTFAISSPYGWDLTHLYTTGEITFLSMADFTGDGVVNGADLAQWQGDFAMNDESDADFDGDSDGADFLAWQRQLSAGLAAHPSGFVPEPGAVCLLILGMIGMSPRRSRVSRMPTNVRYADGTWNSALARVGVIDRP